MFSYWFNYGKEWANVVVKGHNRESTCNNLTLLVSGSSRVILIMGHGPCLFHLILLFVNLGPSQKVDGCL